MKLPDWRVLLGGSVIVSVVAYAFATNASPKRTLAASSSNGASGPVPVTGPLVAQPGETYFAVVTTHRGANFASVADVEKRARAEGFVDVAVFRDPPAAWPTREDGDFYVRATYAGTSPKAFPRSAGNLAGSADIDDVWRA